MLSLLVGCIFGAICAAIASSKGRSGVGWFFAGFFMGIFLILGPIAIIIICCVSNLKDEEARRRYTDMENRRLREQLMQERVKLESLRDHTQARLDAHDQHLGLDTRALASSAPQPVGYLTGGGQPVEALPLAGENGALVWYYQLGEQAVGPASVEQVQQLFASRRLALDTLVWHEGLDDWRPARMFPQFNPALGHA